MSQVEQPRGMPIACLTACAQSHVFEERRIAVVGGEEEAIKIGRAVARWKPAGDNAIFDCKVLSRNHAVLWHEDGRFYLRDTKSSNGTFVNNERLSKGGEESAPRQLLSGDILQFGVDIVENTNKVTHGCIVAILRLFDETGAELGGESSSSSISSSTATLSAGGVAVNCYESSPNSAIIGQHQLFQLQQYIREAAHRERVLEQKLALLQTVLSSTQEASEKSWQALINEDRLLSRIEILEAQLAAYAKSTSEDKLRDDMITMQEEKHKFESLSKETLRRVIQERTEALQRLADVERSLDTTEDECACARARCDQLDAHLLIATNAQTTMAERIAQLTRQLEESERIREAAIIASSTDASNDQYIPPQHSDEHEEAIKAMLDELRACLCAGDESQANLIMNQFKCKLLSISPSVQNGDRGRLYNWMLMFIADAIRSMSVVNSDDPLEQMRHKYEEMMRMNTALQEKYEMAIGRVEIGLDNNHDHVDNETDSLILLISAVPILFPLLIVVLLALAYRSTCTFFSSYRKKKE